MISRLEKIYKDLDEFYQELIDEHLDPKRPKPANPDILDLLIQLKEEKLVFHRAHLESYKSNTHVQDIFVAGTDTGAATIIWAMTALIKNPAIIRSAKGNQRTGRGKRDPEYWDRPDKFVLERFLNSKVDIIGQDFQVIPFGAGRRGCPGISMGLATVELALANLLYTFDWELPAEMKRGC
ncbi:UNVERIFIED_CONTAM: cytochrome [Sesamum latifolium]|uniref:Cytochrome n=1 Tax=Sesamum latifolium TaxID=2727402 RepID=A0AAW2VC73_9LAMI